MLELNKNIYGFFLCLLYIMSITKSVSTTPSLAPSTLTRPLDSNTQISPTLAIILSCLVLFLMAVIFVYIRRMHASSFDEVMGFHFIRQRPVTRGLDPNIIKTFPIFIYSDVKALKIGKSILECAVCLNEFEDEETLRLIPKCCHVFHPECIDAWLAFRTTCPVCRENLKAKPGDLEKLVHIESQNASSPERNDAIVDIYVNIVGPQEVVINPSTQTHGHSCSKKSTSTSYKPPKYIHLPPKSTPRRPKILNMFSRSHSTGHSLIQPDENSERFTLRLPDEARKRLVDLGLSRSYNGPFYLERSSAKGYRFLPTPPMFTKSYLVKEEKGEKEQKNLQKSPSSLFRGTENDDDDDIGEMSFTYFRSSTSS